MSDRNGRQNSAVSINNGFLQAPSGIYFSGPFTITAWINLKYAGTWSRIIDFSFQSNMHGVFFAINSGTSNKISIRALNNDFRSNTEVVYDNWQHVATTVDGIYHRIFINGTLTAEYSCSDLPLNITRSSNYIGKSNFDHDGSTVAIFDELKFFNRALKNSEVLDEMKTSN